MMLRSPTICLALLAASAVAAAAQTAASGPAPAPRVHTPGTTAPSATQPQIGQPRPEAPVATHQPGSWPKLVGKEAAPPPQAWPEDVVKAGRERCEAMLKGLDVVSLPAPPIREGECGAPAPIELISVGKNPQLTFSEPVVVTCDVAAAFHKWLKDDVQPAARELLGAPVMRAEVMSAYSCRNAYGRKKTRLSEHGRANALDIRGFLTDRGMAVDLQADWGPTERDLKAQMVAAKAAEEKAEAVKREAERAAAADAARRAGTAVSPQPAPSAPAGAPAPPSELRGRIDDGGELANGTRSWRPNPVPSLGLTPPSRLGGPKDKSEGKAAPGQARTPGVREATASTAPGLPPKARFLRRIHASACRTFGTILGPEANEAHRNHFHLDMAERKSGSFCE